MAKTKLQSLAALDALRQQITTTLVAGANLSGPALAQLLVQAIDEVKEEVSRGGAARNGVGVPPPLLGLDNDTYIDTASGYEYQKVAGAWVFVLAKKGAPGNTPQKGTDYFDGVDGDDGNRIVDKNYPPPLGRFTDGGEQQLVNYQEGDQWFHTKTLSSYDRYAFLDGQWRLVFRKAEGTTVTPPATTVTATYTATTTDYQTKCSSAVPTGYQFPTGNGQGSTQVAADAAAKTDALGKIVCAVVPPANQIPVANAGADNTYPAETTSFQLAGSGTDADGTISAYLWTRTAGPQASFSSNSVAVPTVTHTGQGTYKFQLVVTDNKGAVSLADEVVVTISAATGGPEVVYTPGIEHIQNSKRVPSSAFAEVSFTTSGTAFSVGFTSNYGGYLNLSQGAVYVNGTLNRVCQLAATNYQVEYFDFTGIPAGATVTLRQGAQDPGPAGTFIVDVKSRTPINFLAPQRPLNRIVIMGDSISVGEGAIPPITRGWTMEFRRLYNAEASSTLVTVDGYGGDTFFNRYSPDVDRAAYIALCSAELDGLNTNILLNNMGRNDCAFGVALADFQAAYEAFLTDMHTARPNVQIIAMTPIYSSDTAAEDFRNAIRVAASGKSWVRVVEGPAMCGASGIGDGIHPSDEGHVQMGRNVFAALHSADIPSDVFDQDDPRIILVGQFDLDTGAGGFYQGNTGLYNGSDGGSYTLPNFTGNRAEIFLPCLVSNGGPHQIYLDNELLTTININTPENTSRAFNIYFTQGVHSIRVQRPEGSPLYELFLDLINIYSE